MDPAYITPLTLTATDNTELFVGVPEFHRVKGRQLELPVLAKYEGNRHADLYCYLPLSASLAEQEAKLYEICAKLDEEHAEFLAENEEAQ